MEKILQELQKENQLLNLSTKKISKLMHPNIKEIYECILIDIKDELDEHRIDIEHVLQRYGDRTGFEASCNEFRINDFVEYESELEILNLALLTMDSWENELKCKFPSYKFCLILDFDDGYATLRFHKKRNDEKNWLTDDLEGYKLNALLVKEI